MLDRDIKVCIVGEGSVEDEKSFDEYWEEVNSKTEWGQYPTEHVIRFIARNYYNRERMNTRILDFGCGGGAHTW